MVPGAPAGIDELDAIPERGLLARYPYALATYTDLHASLGDLEEAGRYLDLALEQQVGPRAARSTTPRSAAELRFRRADLADCLGPDGARHEPFLAVRE